MYIVVAVVSVGKLCGAVAMVSEAGSVDTVSRELCTVMGSSTVTAGG
jgi:hypothetical protein